MTRTIRQPYNSSHIPAMSPKERFARNGAESPMKPTYKKNGAGKHNWGTSDALYDMFDGRREQEVKIKVVADFANRFNR